MFIMSRESHDDVDKDLAVALRWSFHPVTEGRNDRQLGSGNRHVAAIVMARMWTGLPWPMCIKAREIGFNAFFEGS